MDLLDTQVFTHRLSSTDSHRAYDALTMILAFIDRGHQICTHMVLAVRFDLVQNSLIRKFLI